MILSNVEIREAIEAGRFVISPIPEPEQWNTSSLDLRLGAELSFPDQNSVITLDLSQGSIAPFLEKNAEHHNLQTQGAFELGPNRFLLAQTLEHIELPLIPGASPADNQRCVLAARIEGRSSYARCGLLVHFTAPTVHAGFRGPLTLEMLNLGPNRIKLSYGIPICQLILEQVLG